MEELYNSKDFPGMAKEIYTSDCRVLIAHYPLISGRGGKYTYSSTK